MARMGYAGSDRNDNNLRRQAETLLRRTYHSGGTVQTPADRGIRDPRSRRRASTRQPEHRSDQNTYRQKHGTSQRSTANETIQSHAARQDDGHPAPRPRPRCCHSATSTKRAQSSAASRSTT
ncbi:hypothetical protein BTHE_1744 [Bifidobacterium thermophilum]|nr:hypothetical protein BTHE_1744 [Bifidobacterium thermophilum]